MRNARFKIHDCMRNEQLEVRDGMKKVRLKVQLHEKCAVRSTIILMLQIVIRTAHFLCSRTSNRTFFMQSSTLNPAFPMQSRTSNRTFLMQYLFGFKIMQISFLIPIFKKIKIITIGNDFICNVIKETSQTSIVLRDNLRETWGLWHLICNNHNLCSGG